MNNTNRPQSIRPEVMPSARPGRAWAMVFVLSLVACSTVATMLTLLLSGLSGSAGDHETAETHISIVSTPPPAPPEPDIVACTAAESVLSAPLDSGIEDRLSALEEAATPPPVAPAAVPRNGEFAHVFELGRHSYVAISPIHDGYAEPGATAIPAHTNLEDVSEEFSFGALATLDRTQQPADITAWLGQKVVIDGQCEATVDELSLVALATGEFDYMGDRPEGVDRATQLLNAGGLTIAGRLTGCTVDRGVARLANLPLATRAIAVQDASLVAKAKKLLIASPASTKAQAAYRDIETDGAWHADDRYGEAMTGQVVRHPRTGETFVSLHAVVDFGCGGANINLWGLYRVSESRTLTEVHVRDAGSVVSMGHPVDVDGDGMFEFPGQQAMGDRVLMSATGEILRTLSIPYYGCPC